MLVFWKSQQNLRYLGDEPLEDEDGDVRTFLTLPTLEVEHLDTTDNLCSLIVKLFLALRTGDHLSFTVPFYGHRLRFQDLDALTSCPFHFHLSPFFGMNYILV